MKIDPELITKDNPEWSDEMFKQARPMSEAEPELVNKLNALKPRGRPKLDSPKQHIGMRLDADIVSWLRAHKGYNSIVNNALREKMLEEQGA